MGSIYAYALSVGGMTKESSDAAGACWLALTLAAAADGGGYTGITPVREIINRWRAAGYLSSTIGRTIAPVLESLAIRLGQ
jgi:hypothetical protein